MLFPYYFTGINKNIIVMKIIIYKIVLTICFIRLFNLVKVNLTLKYIQHYFLKCLMFLEFKKFYFIIVNKKKKNVLT